jgi:hypothetical protein
MACVAEASAALCLWIFNNTCMWLWLTGMATCCRGRQWTFPLTAMLRDVCTA